MHVAQDVLDFVRVDRFGLEPEQAQDDRRVGAMAFAGPGQRAVQRYIDRHHLARLFAKPGNERQRGLHWTNRVGAGRSDTDLEDVEDADSGHTYSDSSDSRLALPPTAAMLLLTVISVPKRGR